MRHRRHYENKDHDHSFDLSITTKTWSEKCGFRWPCLISFVVLYLESSSLLLSGLIIMNYFIKGSVLKLGIYDFYKITCSA